MIMGADSPSAPSRTPTEAEDCRLQREAAPLVSVVMPCYNQGRFLGDGIESILTQTYSNLEVIVVDDGSNDETPEIVKRYPEVRYLHQEHQRVPTARNLGFSSSRGAFIIFLDADDRLTPNAVQSHLDCFAANPAAGFVVGDIDQVNEDGSHRFSPRYPVLTENFYEELLRVNHIANTNAVMFRRNTIEHLGGFEVATNGGEDYELLLRAARAFPSAHHRNTVAQYRRYNNSMSRRGVRMLRAMDRIMGAQKPFLVGSPRLQAAAREGEAYWRDHFAETTIRGILGQLRSAHPLKAAKASVGLVWYARARLFFLPGRFLRRINNRFRRRQRGNGMGLDPR
ncbi:MAG: glycosyltransferase [Verrucomicrobiota bacterium]